MVGLEEQMSVVLSDHFNLQAQLSNTALSIESKTLNKDDLVHLAAIQKKAESVGTSLTYTIPTKLYNAHRSPDSLTACKILVLPELLESILAYNSVFDILKVYQTCRQLKAIIDESTPLQTQLFLRKARISSPISTKLQLHLLNHAIPDFIIVPSTVNMDGTFHIIIQFSAHERKLAAVGQMWKRMLICQPPLTSVKVEASCGCCASHDYLPLRNLAADMSSSCGGLTFGDLYDKAEELLMKMADSQECICSPEVPFHAFDVSFEASLNDSHKQP